VTAVLLRTKGGTIRVDLAAEGPEANLECESVLRTIHYFEKAFHYFQFNQEEYMDCYHKRSNAESTFSAIKRKFGDSVNSKKEVAMVNEVLCKILCHNLTCLIQEQVTLGITPVFWKDEEQEDGERVILPLTQLQRN
jgi:hypothetical protein